MQIPSRSLAAVFLVVAVSLAAGCGSDDVQKAPTSDAYYVTKERNGDTIALTRGRTLAVVLPAPAGSSSQWTPQGLDSSVLRQVSGARTVGGRHGGMIIGGSKAYQEVSFRAVGSGSTRLTMTRARTQREGGGTDAFRIGVVVR